jgi:hypothetical protein
MSKGSTDVQSELFGQQGWFGDKRLFVNVVELTDDTKVQMLLENLGIKYIGQVVVQEKAKLIRARGYGRKTVRKLEEALLQFDLKLETKLPEWADLTSADLESDFRSEIDQAASWVAAIKHKDTIERLEHEYDLLLGEVEDPRNREMVARRIGLNGREPETLQRIADDLGGLTRERVRQITASFARKIRRKSWSLPALDRAIKLIQRTVPCSEADLSGELIHQRICDEALAIKSIAEAAKLTGRSLPVQRCNFRSSQFWVTEGDTKLPQSIIVLARKEMSADGVVTFDRVADLIERETYKNVLPEFVRQIVATEDGFELLDQDAGWFWFPTSRNRLINTLRKLFAVADRIHVSEVRLAIQRFRRLNGFAPPQRVLLKLAEVLPDFERDGSFIKRAKGVSPENWIEGAELTFATVLREHGGLLDRITLEKECRERGMNEHTFVVYLHGSPLMLKLGRGVFGLVGTDATAGEIAYLESEIPHVQPISEFGWTSEGHIRIQYCITDNMLYTGFFPLPAQICEYLEGQFDLVDEDEQILISIKTKGNVAWSLKKLFRGMGGDIGDPFSLTFDPETKRATISFGENN